MFSSGAAGTASNDSLSLYTLATLGAAGLYVATHGRKLAAEYNEAVAPTLEQPPVTAVAQLGLLYDTTHSSDRSTFNSTSEDEKRAREEAVLHLMRTVHRLHDAKTLPLNFKTTVVSRAGSSTTNVEAGGKDLNSECDDTGNQTGWWKARYDATPLVDGGKKHLPMSFYLEATDATGKHIVHYGLVKSLIMESDQNIVTDVGTRSQGVSYKIYLTLVDTNWLNAGGLPGKNSEINLVVSQQASRCAVSAIVKAGKTYNVFVSALSFSLHPHVPALSDPVKPFYEGRGVVLTSDEYYKLSTPGVLARVNFHANRDRLLSFLVRSLPLLDPSVVWKLGENNVLRVGGRTARTLLPLQVHVRSTERLNDAGDKYIAVGVREVALRFNAEPLPPGDMRSDPSFVQSVSFKLENNAVLSQDMDDRVSWYVGDKKLEGTPSIDLVVLSREPGTANFRLPKDVTPIVNGARTFSSFEAPMFANQQVTVDKEAYDRLRAETPSKADGDLTTSTEEGRFPAVIAQESWMMVAAVAAVFVLGWKFTSHELAMSANKLVRLFCFAGAAGVAGLALAEYRGRPEAVGYDSVVLGVACLCSALALAASLAAVRLAPDTAPCIGLGVASAMVAGVLLYYFSVPMVAGAKPKALATTRIALLLSLAQALALLGVETGKVAQKVNKLERMPQLPVSLGLPSVALAAFVGACGFVIVLFGYIGSVMRAPDRCLPIQEKVDRLASVLPPAGTVAASVVAAEQDAAMNSLQACSLERVAVPEPLMRTWWLPLAALVAALGLAQFVAAAASVTLVKSVLPASVEQARFMGVEDGRASRGAWMLKTLVGCAILGTVIASLYPSVEAPKPACTEARKAYTRERTNASGRMEAIGEEMDRMGCTPNETLVARSAAAVLLTALVASFVVPVTQKVVYHKASTAQALGLFAFTCATGVATIWALNPLTKEHFTKKKLPR